MNAVNGWYEMNGIKAWIEITLPCGIFSLVMNSADVWIIGKYGKYQINEATLRVRCPYKLQYVFAWDMFVDDTNSCFKNLQFFKLHTIIPCIRLHTILAGPSVSTSSVYACKLFLWPF